MAYAQKEISEGPKILSETEIQERLYGEYLGRKKHLFPDRTPPADWTGTEILQGELNALRTELIGLRREKERLLSEMELTKRGSSHSSDHSKKDPRSWFSVGKLSIAGMLLLAGLIAYPSRTQFLQAASPSGLEQTPYTVQVGVYDARRPADRVVQHLSELGYSAFLAEFPNRTGRTRYRIYVGRFVTKQEADLEKLKLTTDPRFSDAFVRLQ